MTPLQILEQKIESARKRLAFLESMRDGLADNTTATDIEEIFGSARLNQRVPPLPPRPRPMVQQAIPIPSIAPHVKGKTVVEKMRNFFRETGNKPATIEELTDELHCSTGAIRQVLYRANSNEFDRHSLQGGGRPSTFWLKDMPKGGDDDAAE